MIAAQFALASFIAMYALWVLYLAIMNLVRARDAGNLTKWSTRFGYPLLAIGYLMDFAVNVTLLSVIMLEIPQELLVTARLTRHINDDAGWRNTVATWICHNLLDFADPSGCHCKKTKD